MSHSESKKASFFFNLLNLLRVYQWVKNLFMFLPIFFAGKLFNPDVILDVIPGFFAFSLVASSIYIYNDYKDLEDDRKHPEKKNRAMASGAINPQMGLVISIISLFVGLCLAYFTQKSFFIVIIAYFLMNIAYTIKLKQVPILDICIIATGFLFRILAGGFIVDIFLSKWLLIMTFLLALLMGFAKRRDDVLILLGTGQSMRKAVKGYNLEFINASVILMAGIVVVSYLMYTVSEDVVMRFNNDYLYITTLPVIVGILRYLQLTMVMNNSANPTKILLKDRFLQIIIFLWIALFYTIIYVKEFKLTTFLK